MTAITDLKTRRDWICTQLAAMQGSAAGGKPNVVGGTGASIDHVRYRMSLYEELAAINRVLADSEGAVEIESLGDV